MSEIHALSGAYAINALDETEREQFDLHLAECAECRAEVASFGETAALLAETGPEAPPASLRAGVLGGIKNIRPLPPEAERVSPLRPGRRTLPTLVAAAVAVILLAVGAVAWHPWSTDTRSDLADRVVHAQDAVRATQSMPGGGKVVLVRSPSLQRAVLITDHVPPPTAGSAYQLWLQQPGKGMVSAGLVSDSSDTTVLTGDAATAKAAAITVEPATGSPRPTSQPLVTFPFSGSGQGST
jgi:anti-sigma-K factor RskA